MYFEAIPIVHLYWKAVFLHAVPQISIVQVQLVLINNRLLKSETCFLNMELCLGGIAVGGSIFYVELEEAVRRPDANLSLERVKMSHFEGSKLYHRGPFR